MDKKQLEIFLKQLGSPSGAEVLSGLRGVQELFSAAGTSVEDALRYAAVHPEKFQRAADQVIENQPVKKPAAAIANISGVPECRVPYPGAMEIVLAGNAEGTVYPLPGEAANDAEIIASNLKDAVVAAVINKSRFKLKLLDVKNGKGEVMETVLQAEYEREGMIPIRVWVNSRGEVGALAAVLRKAVANSLPELVAA